MKNKKNIKRSLYIQAVQPFMNKNIVKVLIGQRRVGKSYMLLQLIEEILLLNPEANIIFVNKELEEFRKIRNDLDLNEYIEQRTVKEKLNYIFIDEIQDIEGFEKCLRNLQALELYDIYITGSNANLLSGELATYISGRYIEINIYGLTYMEFLKFHNLENNVQSLQKYMKYGGLPYLIHLDLDDRIIYDYLKNIYAAILYKDLIARYNIRNVQFLESLIWFLSDNLGSIVSARKISEFLKSQKINISVPVVLNYLRQLESVFFIHKVKRAEIVGKKIFEIGEKYYFEDIGIRNAIVGYRPDHVHKIIENLIFLHLKASGYNINVGVNEGREIDFVGTRNNEKIYIQAAFRLSDPSTLNREFGNLKAIRDNYPKMVVTMDELMGNTNIDGIEHMHLLDFLTRMR